MHKHLLHISKYATVLVLLLLVVGVQAQIFTSRNFVKVPPGFSEQQIAELAATVRPSQRQLKWQQLELTAFIHFGINTFTNREWGDGKESPTLFNPTELDARQWVRICKENGFKQIILTAKHHDGFCLWPSKFTEHSVKNSPWRAGTGDLVREVAKACKEFGVGFGVYLSPWDRNAASFGSDAYNDYFINQLTELLTNYGPIAEVWFDGANGEGPNGKKQVYQYDRWYKLIRKLQPKAVIAVSGPDVRWVGTESGYGRDTEWSVVPGDALLQDRIAANSQKDVAFAPVNMMDADLGSRKQLATAKSLVWYPAETDVSIRPGWFYHPAEDNSVKSGKELFDIYLNSVGKNGVLLLNIPPDKRGLIHDSDIKALKAFQQIKSKVFEKDLLARVKPLKAANGKSLTYNFVNPVKINLLQAMEAIEKGQRVEQFSLMYWHNGAWKQAVQGTTVGYMRLLHFNTLETTAVKLIINATRATPKLSAIRLFNTDN